MNPIKAFRQFISDFMVAINDPYICLTEEGKRMWREIEELERQNQRPHEETKSEIKNGCHGDVTHTKNKSTYK